MLFFQCYGLNQHYDYDVSKPPTILFRHKNGQIAQTNDGKLVITPGAIVHMECLSIRYKIQSEIYSVA